MGNTAEDMHRGLNPAKPGFGLQNNSINQSKCFLIVEEPNEDCVEDDIISEEEDKRIMEKRNRRVNEDRLESSSGRSSASAGPPDRWVSTYKKLRRASELIGASAVAIDNKIELAMDLVKNHLMFAVREEMEAMRVQIRELVERNKQLEEENVFLRASTTSEKLVKMFNTHMSNSTQQQQAINNKNTTDDSWTDEQIKEKNNSAGKSAMEENNPAYLSRLMGPILATSPNQDVTPLHLSSTPPTDFSGRFLISPLSLSSHFQNVYSTHPHAISHSASPASASPQFFFINPDADLDSYNVTWSPSTNYKIFLTKTGSDPDLQQQHPEGQHHYSHLHQPHH